MESHYDVLGVPLDASETSVRRAYHKLSLVYHPDKASGDVAAMFHRVRTAYEVLSDSARRSDYNAALSRSRRHVITDDVDLNEMDLQPGEPRVWSLPCRCGGEYLLPASQVELGVLVASCDTCSLAVQVHVSPVQVLHAASPPT